MYIMYGCHILWKHYVIFNQMTNQFSLPQFSFTPSSFQFLYLIACGSKILEEYIGIFYYQKCLHSTHVFNIWSAYKPHSSEL